MSERMLEGKVAVVTGAGGGIGREIALMMSLAGAKIVINDIGASVTGEGASATPAEQTKGIIEQRGGQAVINTNSVASWNAARGIVENAMDAFGRIDIVVNNAGILRDVIFHKMTEDDWNSVINVHLNGSFYVSRAAAEHFRKQESGAFVHMSSTSGLIGNFPPLHFGRDSVVSNCIAPFAWSRMTGSIPAETPEQKARVEKIKQMTPDKNAPMAVFLASDQAKGVSGQVFATRNNEIFLMSSPRPIRSVHRSEGWTPETIAEHGIHALKGAFMPLDRSGEVFTWDPI